jgi:hypothetical protein
MARHDGKLDQELSVKDVRVRAADAAGVNFNQRVIRADFGHISLLNG